MKNTVKSKSTEVAITGATHLIMINNNITSSFGHINVELIKIKSVTETSSAAQLSMKKI